MAQIAPLPPATSDESLLQRELIETVRNLVQTLGLPRSLGEIYGFLYVSVEPQSMDQIRDRLGVSLGSVSQGLRQLRALKAVRVVYVTGERKDYFAAETELRRFVSAFFREILLPQVEESQHRLDTLRPVLEGLPEHREHYRGRFEKMYQWHQTARRWLRPLTRLTNR